MLYVIRLLFCETGRTRRVGASGRTTPPARSLFLEERSEHSRPRLFVEIWGLRSIVATVRGHRLRAKMYLIRVFLLLLLFVASSRYVRDADKKFLPSGRVAKWNEIRSLVASLTSVGLVGVEFFKASSLETTNIYEQIANLRLREMT